MENKHTSLSSQARENSVSLTPPSQSRHVWSSPAIEPCLTPGFHPGQDAAQPLGRASHQRSLLQGCLQHPGNTRTLGDLPCKLQTAGGIPGWGEPTHLPTLNLQALNVNLQGYTLQRKAIPVPHIIFGAFMGCATSCRAVSQETCLTGLR